MYNATNSQEFDTTLSDINIYANSALDVYCNQTFYSSLSIAMQNAIVSKDFRQDSWDEDCGYADYPCPVRPAFQIDLSKDTWTKQG